MTYMYNTSNPLQFFKLMMESIVAKNTPIKDFKKQIEKEAKKQGVECELKANRLVASCDKHDTLQLLFLFF